MDHSLSQSIQPLYQDIANRTQGDIYMGVVGPVRTGKSSLIAALMEKMVLPCMAEGPRKERLMDEMPQPASGRMVMTTQPCFFPGEGAAEITLGDGVTARVRLVDSVGYLVPGAIDSPEGEGPRLVSTPWAEEDLPFREAAALGTRKVMEDHAQMGLVVTCDGSICDLPRESYVQAEAQIIREMKQLQKPFVVVLNSAHPEGKEAKALQSALEKEYDVPVALLNVKEMEDQQLQDLLSSVLMEFPLQEIRFSLPEWMGALEDDHWLPRHTLDIIRGLGNHMKKMRDRDQIAPAFAASAYLSPPQEQQSSLGRGSIQCRIPAKEGLFNQILSEQCGADIQGDAHLLSLMKELVAAKHQYDRVAGALREVEQTGYGLVTPAMSEISLRQPELMRQGSRYGVKLRASAPTLHLIRSDIETEIAPILGAQEQSEQFVETLQQQFDQDPDSLWNTNFFGRSLQSLIQEGLSGKLHQMPVEAQEKVQQALTRMLNEGDGGMICILL